jgi:CRP-like cAMP-binding protein
MSSCALSIRPPVALEDPLEYLPRTVVVKYLKGDVIYSHEQLATGIYLVISGSVKVFRPTDHGRPTIIDVYRPDEFFGESALLGLPLHSDDAVAFENAAVMTWPADAIKEIAMRRPQLAMALLQGSVQRSMGFNFRIDSLAVDSVDRRLARTLIRFSERFGCEAEEGCVQMIPLTHEFLAEYVGTSREIVTKKMDVFRDQGYLSFSRRGITLRRDALDCWLKSEPYVQ